VLLRRREPREAIASIRREETTIAGERARPTMMVIVPPMGLGTFRCRSGELRNQITSVEMRATLEISGLRETKPIAFVLRLWVKKEGEWVEIVAMSARSATAL
jgi:hypothetical protein